MKTSLKPIIMTTLMMFMIFFMNVQEGTAQTQEVHQEVDVMPQPPGGMSGLMAFMMENLKYPEQAKEKGWFYFQY